LNRVAIILAGGKSQRFGLDKGLVKLADKPLILHVLDRVRGLVDEVIVCLKNNSQLNHYLQILPSERERIKMIIDSGDLPQCPLTGAFTGLINAGGEYSALLPCDTPFISEQLIDLMFNIAVGVDAVIPRWPNDYIEPLQAVYRTEAALEAARETLKKGDFRMRSMISLLKRVRYISTLVVEEIDPKMYTFFNINTPVDLRRAEMLIKRGIKP
jgi:molybdopterin-guanine dinucleotide biosynthesis protein A